MSERTKNWFEHWMTKSVSSTMFRKARIRKVYITFRNLITDVSLRRVLEMSRNIINPTTVRRATAESAGVKHELFNTTQRAAETVS